MKNEKLFSLVIILMLFSVGLVIAQESGTKLSANLTGAAEVPGPGDTDGSGTVEIRLNQGKGEVCFDLDVKNIGTATMAHIHDGVAGKAGPPVVTLTPLDADGDSEGCVKDVDKELIKRIRDNPENFYVNVHNAEFPDGAIRGQLAKPAKN